MNSREKGKRGERQWRDELRAQGFQARRGQQFSGSAESPDVVCEELCWIHFEVKAVEKLNVQDAMDQARADARGESRKKKVESGKGEEQSDKSQAQRGKGQEEQSGKGQEQIAGKVPVVAHRRNFRPWLVTMTAEVFFQFVRGDLPPCADVPAKVEMRFGMRCKPDRAGLRPEQEKTKQQTKQKGTDENQREQ